MEKNTTILNSQAIDKLVIDIEESMRAAEDVTKREDAVKRFVPPTQDALARAVARQHHLVFGRRGSGKSSLLHKAMADLTIQRRPVAYIDLESFKEHSYPDVLLSILVKIFSEFEKWLKTAAINPSTKTSFWHKFGLGVHPSRAPFNRKEALALAGDLNLYIKNLTEVLYAADNIDTHSTVRKDIEVSDQREIGVQLGTGTFTGKVSLSQKNNGSQELQEAYRQSKLNYLYTHILEYQSIFDRMFSLSNGASYLFLDDLYHLQRDDQARVIDYCHRLAKGHNLWLKIGSVRHRTQSYIHGNPIIGLKQSDDVEVIDLDLTLENYALTKQFLIEILAKFISDHPELSLQTLLTEQTADRLTQASGGVARDFLGIFRKTVYVAKERATKPTMGGRGPKITVEDVNAAAGSYDGTKRQEMIRDATDDHKKLEEMFDELTAFCIDHLNTNVFIIDEKAKGEWVDLIQELVDLRLLHKTKSHFTLKRTKSARRRYDAYMIDLSQYADIRKKKGIEEIKFWEPENEDLRNRSSLIYDPERAKNSIKKDTKPSQKNEKSLATPFVQLKPAQMSLDFGRQESPE